MTEQSNFTEKSCKNMCGFFGSEANDGYCSVCYKKHVENIEREEDEQAIAIRSATPVSRQSRSPECLTACGSMSFDSPTPQMILASRMSPTNLIVHGCISDIKCQVRTPSKSPTLQSAHEVPPMSALKSGTGMPGYQESFDILDNLQIDESAERYFEYHQRHQRSSNCDDCPSFTNLKAQVTSASRTHVDEGNSRRSPTPSNETSTSACEDDDKAKSNRCGVCRRKLGLTGFMCRCGGKFCGLHRYSDKHECTFDYKEYGQREIRKNNPVVSGEKITKI